jgi:hypothetical protein
VKIGNPPTEYDLEADAERIGVKVYEVTSVGQQKVNEIKAAFAFGYAVRIGDAFLVAYLTSDDGSTIFTLSNGSAFSQGFTDDERVHIWVVSRAS